MEGYVLLMERFVSTATSCKVVEPGEGRAYWAMGEKMIFKVGREDTDSAFLVDEVVSQPQNGPPPHIHRREDEMFLVVEGDFIFSRKDRSLRCKKGDAVYMAKGVLHTYNNVGSKPGKLLVICAPCGFEEFIAAWGEPVADPMEQPPADRAAAIDRLIAAAGRFGLEMVPEADLPAEASELPACRSYWVMGQHVTIRLASSETRFNFTAVDVISPPGTCVPEHAHIAMDEFFYVVEGNYEFSLPSEKHCVGPGTLVYVPRGHYHGFRNAGETPARLLDVHTPGGFDAFFEEAGVPATDSENPPYVAPKDPEEMKALARRHGMELA